MSATGRSRHHRRDGRGTRAHEQLLHAEEQAARDSLAGYNARENARAARMRAFVRACEVCGDPIYEEPPHCTSCAWDGPEVGR